MTRLSHRTGFTLIELLVVMSLLLVVITLFYRFYHEAYLEHGSGVRQEMARLQKTRVFMRYLETDLQKYVTAVTGRDSSGEAIVSMPATGSAMVSYRLESNGVVMRRASGESLALLDGVKALSMSPYNHAPGLYRLQLGFVESPAVHSTLDGVDRVMGFPMVKGGVINDAKSVQ